MRFLRTLFIAALTAGVLGVWCGGTAWAASPTRVVTLGTGGGPITRLQRAESSNALIVGDTVYVIDCGDRCLLQLAAAHIPLEKVRAIFFTHYHQDHVGGLAPLLGIRWMTNVPGVLKLIGPPGLEQIVKGYRMAMQPSVDAGFGQTPDPMAALEVDEVAAGEVYQDENVKVSAVQNTHYHSPVANPANVPKSYSYRFETPAGVVVFTGDTGPSPAVTALAKGADLLVSEVIDLQGTIRLVDKNSGGKLSPQIRDNVVRHLTEDHLLPEQVGQMAKEAGVKQVVLSHLSPGEDNEDAEAAYGRGVRSVFKGPVTVAKDLETFTIGGGEMSGNGVDMRRHLTVQTAVSVAINSVLSLLFGLAVLHGRSVMPLAGVGGMAFDFFPQTFMITFATVTAVTLATRSQVRRGSLQGSSPKRWTPSNAILRAVVAAILFTVILAPLAGFALALAGIGKLEPRAFSDQQGWLWGAGVAARGSGSRRHGARSSGRPVLEPTQGGKMNAFVQNAWYMAAWAAELSDTMLARRIAGRKLLIARRQDGGISVLDDRCPHRFAPLSQGVRSADQITCPYHGLTFDLSGICVRNPFSEHIPAAARVPSYEAQERDGIAWVWLGDPAYADAAKIPDFSALTAMAMTKTLYGYMPMQANYEYGTDNLMDLSHIEFVHKGSFAGNGVIFAGKHEVRQEGQTVWSNWWMPGVKAPPHTTGAYPPDMITDHWLDMRWDAPASMKLEIGATPTGQAREGGVVVQQAHILTPETEGTTHYFWASTYAAPPGAPDLGDVVRGLLTQAFDEEDKPIIEASYANAEGVDFWARKPVLLGIDAGSVRARRLIQAMQKAEVAPA